MLRARFFPSYALWLILAASFSLLLWGAFTDSLIVDEQAHIPAGFGYFYKLDYRLNPEHPPLVKALSALPLGFLHPTFPETRPSWTEEVNSQWTAGEEFLFESGNDATLLLRLARLAPILLTLLTTWFIYQWGRDLLGGWWGLVPTALFALSPIVLAHGHYVTTDVAAAFGAVLATYYFLRFLKAPSQERLFFAGISLGIAELTKFSALLLLPYFLLLIILHSWGTSPTSFLDFFRTLWKRLGAFLLLIFAAYALVVYPVYALFTLQYPTALQQSDTKSILSSFEGGPPAPGTICKPLRCAAELTIAATKNPLTRPLAQYALGFLMVLQRERGANTNYFLGEVSSSGTPYYFPIVYALKESIPVLLFLLFALAGGLFALARGIPRWFTLKRLEGSFPKFLGRNFELCALFLFVLLYWGWSIKSNLNIGIRHIIPVLPFMYLLASYTAQRMLHGTLSRARRNPASFFHSSTATLAWTFAFFAGLWFLTETAFAAPFFLSYFNEFAGGTAQGFRYVMDSNYDWGQDWLRFKEWVERNNVSKIAVDHFGGGNPNYYLGDRAVAWESSKGSPLAQGIHWLAVSVNTLQNAVQPTSKGYMRKPEDEYRWLTALRPPKPGMGNLPEPDFRVGTSIFVYKL